MKNYKIVITMEFPNGDERFVIWEPELYGKLVYSGVDVEQFLTDMSKNDFKTPPLTYLIELWENPHLENIVSVIGSNKVILPICVGTKVFPIIRY